MPCNLPSRPECGGILSQIGLDSIYAKKSKMPNFTSGVKTSFVEEEEEIEKHIKTR